MSFSTRSSWDDESRVSKAIASHTSSGYRTLWYKDAHYTVPNDPAGETRRVDAFTISTTLIRYRVPYGRDLRLSPQLLDDYEREQDGVRHLRLGSLRPDVDAQPGSRRETYGNAARMVRLSHAILRPSVVELHCMCLEVSIRPGDYMRCLLTEKTPLCFLCLSHTYSSPSGPTKVCALPVPVRISVNSYWYS